MKLGDFTVVTRSFCTRDLTDYTTLSQHVISGDLVPEPLIGALFSYLLGVELPGYGTNYLKQETRFHAAARVGDAVTARVEITRIRPEKNLVDLSTTCTDSNGQLLASGRALVSVQDIANFHSKKNLRGQ